jgi:hypothetical protein
VAKTTKNKLKEGRHVGLDFYDLLIEALNTGEPAHGRKFLGNETGVLPIRRAPATRM